MAKIPLYQPEQKLISQSPMAQRSISAESQFGRDLQGVGNNLIEASESIRKMYDLQQTGSAKLLTAKGLAGIEAEGAQDGNNTGDLTPYQAKIKQLKADALKEISTPAAKARFEQDFDLAAISTEIQLKKGFWQNAKNKSLANLNELGTITQEQYSKSPDPSILDTYYKNVDIYVSHGIINADDAQKFKNTITLKAKESSLTFDIMNNPALAESKIKNNAYGFDIDKLEKATKLYDRSIGRIQADNEEAIILADVNNKPFTIGQLTDMANRKLIRPKFAQSQIKILKDPPVDPKTDDATYQEIISLMIRQDQDKSITDSMIKDKIMEARAEGKLMKGHYNNLLYSRKFGREISIYEGAVEEGLPKTNWIAGASKVITDFTSRIQPFWPGFNPLGITQVVLARAQAEQVKGDKLSTIAKEEIDKVVLSHNPDKIKYEIGKVYSFKNGKSGKCAGYRDDGTPIFEVVNNKPKEKE